MKTFMKVSIVAGALLLGNSLQAQVLYPDKQDTARHKKKTVKPYTKPPTDTTHYDKTGKPPYTKDSLNHNRRSKGDTDKNISPREGK